MTMRNTLSRSVLFRGLLVIVVAAIAVWQLLPYRRRALPTADQIARTIADANRSSQQLNDIPSSIQQKQVDRSHASVDGGEDSHQRMLLLLKDIAKRTAQDNPYLGDAEAVELTQRLGALTEGADVKQRFELLNKLGVKQLQLGRTQEAIKCFQQCLALVPQGWTDVMNKVEYQLAVGYLRQAEDENCVMCTNGDSCILPIRNQGIHRNRAGSENAIKHLTSVLTRTPEHVSARWLLNLAHMTLGGYPEQVPDRFRLPTELFKTEIEFPRFENIAAKLKLDEVSLAGGMVVDDFNADGWLDVVTSQWSTSGQVRIYLSNGDGTFRDSTKTAGIEGIFGGLNLIQADYDNDKDLDILVLRGAWWAEAGCHPNSLLENDGQGRFRDVTFAVGLGKNHYPTQTAAWSDYDNDGDLDVYIGNELYPCQLFRNNGRGSFEDVAQDAGVIDGGFAKGVTWGDFNNDRYPDLYVSNLDGANRLFRNNKDGTFTDVAHRLGVQLPNRSFATWFWDFNNDGALDLFCGAYSANIGIFAADYIGLPHQGQTDRLYQGDGQGNFIDVSEATKVNRVTVPMGSNFGDLDNDGFDDFYLGTGDPNFDSLMPNRMYLNQQGKRFIDVSNAGGFAHLQKGHGVAFADYDADGDQDVFIELGGAFPGDAFANALFQNPGFNNNWLGIKLAGKTSNTFGIGARLRIVFSDGEKDREVYRWINSGGSFGGNPLHAHVGLNKATNVKRLEIYWPTSDATQVFTDIPANQMIRVIEQSDRWETIHNSGSTNSSRQPSAKD